MIVPFQPAARKPAHLVTTGTQIPRLGDHLHLRQHRVLPYGHKKCSFRAEPVFATAQHRRQVEPEPIHMHGLHPITQAVHHQL